MIALLTSAAVAGYGRWYDRRAVRTHRIEPSFRMSPARSRVGAADLDRAIAGPALLPCFACPSAAGSGCVVAPLLTAAVVSGYVDVCDSGDGLLWKSLNALPGAVARFRWSYGVGAVDVERANHVASAALPVDGCCVLTPLLTQAAVAGYGRAYDRPAARSLHAFGFRVRSWRSRVRTVVGGIAAAAARPVDGRSAWLTAAGVAGTFACAIAGRLGSAFFLLVAFRSLGSDGRLGCGPPISTVQHLPQSVALPVGGAS